MANKNVEYICTQCWHSFEIEVSADETVTCPSCGAEQPQPNAEDVTVPQKDEESLSEAPTQTLEQTEVSDESEDKEEGESKETGEEESGDPLDAVDPTKCGWRVRSGGLTYNFHGINALQNWCSGKKNLEKMEISIEDIGDWINLDEFRGRLRKEDPIEAFRNVGGFSPGKASVKTKEKAEEKTEVKTEVKTEAETEVKTEVKSEEKKSSGRKERTSPAPRDPTSRIKKPSIRSTGEFTFKIRDTGAPPAKKWMTMVSGVMIGLLLGLALWYLGILSALPVTPLDLLGP